MLIVTDSTRRVLYWDEAISRMTGLTPAQFESTALYRQLARVIEQPASAPLLQTVPLADSDSQLLATVDRLHMGDDAILLLITLNQPRPGQLPCISLDLKHEQNQPNQALLQLAETMHCDYQQLLPEVIQQNWKDIPLAIFSTEVHYQNLLLRWLIMPRADGQTLYCLGMPVDEQELYQQILEYSVDGIYQTHRSGKILFANQALLQLFGYDNLEGMQRAIQDVSSDLYVHPEHRHQFVSLLDEHGIAEAFECQMRTATGKIIWLRQNARSVRGINGKTVFIIGTVSDITQQKRAEQALRYAEEQYRGLYENAVAGLFRSSIKGYFLSVNPALATMFGFNSPAACIRYYTDLSNQLYVKPQQRKQLLRQMLSNKDVIRNEMEVYRRDGSTMWILQNLRLVRDANGKALHIEGSTIDITQSKQAQQRINHLAHHDSLTQLPNRIALAQQISRCLGEVSKGLCSGFYLLMLDLDNFKDINDTQGHGLGDQLLQIVADRIRSLPAQHFDVARIGGDEFALLVRQNDQTIETFCQQLLDVIAQPMQLSNQLFRIGASIGVVHYQPTDPLQTADQALQRLLRQADLALYQSKDNGRNCYSFYSPDLDARLQETRQLERDLYDALRSEEQFFLVFQPLINCANGRLLGAEVLLRWQHPDRGLISPAQFIPLAENCGLSSELDDWVLRHACQQLRQWQDRDRPLPLSVNLSAQQFSQLDLLSRIQGLIDEFAIAPAYLGLELTETAALTNHQTAVTVLKQLRELGISIALDDFGTGYSSLGYLQDMPVTKVKLDRAFIAGIVSDPRQRAIVSAVVSLVRSLGLILNVEGVETVEQFKVLQAFHVDELQGFLLGRPVIAAELERQWLGAEGWQALTLPD
ncbi:putative bifunctional diguanylate cyclase/phosphodiesterase [Pokkaliibacter plantistimulans]|nr:bifunctional diguanylate cyclase/phosphodiesterase [Pokkaliibacter plantistimulans]